MDMVLMRACVAVNLWVAGMCMGMAEPHEG